MPIFKNPKKIQLPPITVIEIVAAMDTRNADLSSRDCHSQSTVASKQPTGTAANGLGSKYAANLQFRSKPKLSPLAPQQLPRPANEKATRNPKPNER